MSEPERIDSGQIESSGKAELMERLAQQAQTIETQRQLIARLEQGMVRLTHELGGHTAEERMLRDERDAALARAEAVETMVVTARQAYERYHQWREHGPGRDVGLGDVMDAFSDLTCQLIALGRGGSQ
jgi:hypothetical protein